MVNVPGRSKGCNTCRKRKKGCDLQKPNCARCVRDNLKCEGYERPIIFVNHEPRAGSTVARRPRPRSYLDQVLYQVLSPSSSINGSLSRISTQEGTFALFWESYLPKGRFVPPGGLQTLTHYAWVDALQKLSTQSQTLRLALCAVSLSSVALRVNDQALRTEGAELYGLALARLNHTLQTPQIGARDDSVIPAITFLSMYEQFNGFSSTQNMRQGSNWQTHSLGVSRLLQVRGPDLQNSEYGHLNWRICRISQYALSLMARKKSIFAAPEWKTLPWLNKPKTVRDLLIDTLLDLPGSLELADVALDIGSGSYELRITALKTLLDNFHALGNWHEVLLVHLAAEKSTTTPIGDPSALYDHPEWYMDQGIDVAGWMLQLWSARLIICATIRTLTSQLATAHVIDTYRNDAFNPELYALTLVRCVSKLSLADAGILTYQITSLNIGIVLTYFAAHHSMHNKDGLAVVQALADTKTSGPYGPMILYFLRQMSDEVNGTEFAGKKDAGQATGAGWDVVRKQAQKWFHVPDNNNMPPLFAGKESVPAHS